MSQPEITFCWVFVTPRIAHDWLALSAGNRGLRPHRVAQLKRDLINGDFVHTHHAIGFDENGELFDGHHRLTAIMESEIPAWLAVASKVPRSSMAAIDAGLPRSISDSIKMLGEGRVPHNTEVAVASCIELLPVTPLYKYSRSELISVLTQGADSILFGVKTRKTVGITKATRCLISRAHLADRDPKRLDEFSNMIQDGVPVSQNASDDIAAITFRNYLMRLIGVSGRSTDVERYRKGQVALQAFLERRPLTKLYTQKKDLFPLPEHWNRVAGSVSA